MADEIIYDKNISQVTTPELAENKNGVSHGVKESINILSGAGQKQGKTVMYFLRNGKILKIALSLFPLQLTNEKEESLSMK